MKKNYKLMRSVRRKRSERNGRAYIYLRVSNQRDPWGWVQKWRGEKKSEGDCLLRKIEVEIIQYHLKYEYDYRVGASFFFSFLSLTFCFVFWFIFLFSLWILLESLLANTSTTKIRNKTPNLWPLDLTSLALYKITLFTVYCSQLFNELIRSAWLGFGKKVTSTLFCFSLIFTWVNIFYTY